MGPVLFLLYVSSGLSKVISKHLPRDHAFDDDTQLYLSFKPNPDNYNQITTIIIIGSRQQLIKLSIDKLRVGDVNVSPVNTINNLGSWFDMHMSMDMHVGKVCSKAFRSLYHINSTD